MFVAVLTYVRPLEEVDALIAEHLRFLEENYAAGLFVASGRKVPRTGGVILISGENRARVVNILERDPFHVAGVAIYELIEFIPTRMREGFEPFV
jgi:uncharacterized protein YciI